MLGLERGTLGRGRCAVGRRRGSGLGGGSGGQEEQRKRGDDAGGAARAAPVAAHGLASFTPRHPGGHSIECEGVASGGMDLRAAYAITSIDSQSGEVLMRIFLLATALLCGVASPARSAPATEAEEASRRSAFRAFAGQFVGEWICEIQEYNGTASEPVWSDRQRRIFTLTMNRNFLEERAILKRSDGADYEAGLHLTTYDPQADRIVQHGYWIPRQPEPLFRLDGRIAGGGFIGRMRIRNEDGSESVRPLIMKWLDRDSWAIEVTGNRTDGSTYLRERLLYKRVPA